MRIDDILVSVDEEKCTGCGICANACPSGAIELDGLSDKELWSRINSELEGDEVFFSCTLRPNEAATSGPETSINLPCLSVLKESHLAGLVLSGVVERLSLDLSGCNECPMGSRGRAFIESAVTHSRALLDPAGMGDRIETTDVAPEKTPRRKRSKVKQIVPGPEYSRRELFSAIRQKAGEKAVESVLGRSSAGPEAEEVGEVGGLPDRRAILLDVLKGMETPPEGVLAEGSFPVHNLGVKDGCTMCGVCESFCPTGALKIVGAQGDEGEEIEDPDITLEFRMERCVGCFKCAELCPEGVIYYKDEFELARLVSYEAGALITMKRLKCSECRRFFYTELHPGGCPTCKKKGGLDDKVGSLLYGDGWNTDGDKGLHGRRIS